MANQLAGRTLRQLMQKKCVGLPGAFNGLVARAAAQQGFDGLYVSGAAVTARSGVPDIGLLGLDDFCRAIRDVSVCSALPLIADADTGFGETEMVVRVVSEYHRAGAAGFHIEDQVFPKRCGHLDGKELVPAEHFADKVARAAHARDIFTNGDFIVCARTDAMSVLGLDEVIARSKLYVDAGADMIFPEGLTCEEDFATVAEALQGYKPPVKPGAPERLLAPGGGPFLLANMTEFGKTPIIPLQRFEELGYHCTIFPVSSLRSAMGAVNRMLAALKRDGHVKEVMPDMLTRQELYEMLGYTPGKEYTYPNASYGEEGRTEFKPFEGVDK